MPSSIVVYVVSVTIEGTVEGNLTAIGGTVNLEEDAIIKGDLISPGSYINQKPGAEVHGEQISGWQIPWTKLSLPFNHHPGFPKTTGTKFIPTLTKIGKETGFTLLLVALGALMLLVMPKSSEVMTKALEAKPWHLFGFGALTAIVAAILVIFLTLTLCLAPVAILIGLAFGLAVLAGWLALGYELGKRIAAGIFNTAWNPVLAAAMGNLVLYLMARGIRLIPCLGGFLGFLVMLFGLGMSVVTLFGTNPYPRQALAPVNEQIVLTSSAIESEIESGATDNNILPESSEENTAQEPDNKENPK